MKVILKKTVTIFILISFLFNFAGCRKKTQPNQENKNLPQKIELVWWHLFDPCDTFIGQIQAFESEYKNVRILCKKFSNPLETEKLIINEIAEGEGPDIFSIQNTKVQEHHRKIIPIPANIMIPQQFKDTFFAVASDDLILETESSVEGIYALPLYIDTLALYYNKSMFRDRLPATDKPGETWEEIKEQVYALVKKNNSVERFATVGLAAGRSDNIHRAIDILKLLLLQLDTKMFDNGKAIFALQNGTLPGSGKPFYPGREALKVYTSFALPSYKNYSWNKLITSFTGDSKEVGVFVNKKAAMIFGYSWLYEEILLQIQAAQKKGHEHLNKEEIGIAPCPQISLAENEKSLDAIADYFALTVSKNSAHPEIAWNFIHFLTSRESLQDYHKKTHKPTSRKDMIEEQSTEKLFGVFARQASFAKSITTINDDSFKIIFSEAIDSVVKAKQTIEEALSLAQRKMNCVIEKQKNPTMDQLCEKI